MALNFDSVKLETTEEKGGYGIGLQIGQQLLGSGLEVEPETVMKGIFDVLHQNPPAVDVNEITVALQELQQRAEKAQQAMFAQIEQDGKAFLEENKKAKGVQVTESGLQYEVLVEGNGKVPSAEDKVRVHYAGSLITGQEFDSSIKRGEPAEFPVNGVIKGWVEALTMMPAGSKWRLVVPHELAYGERGAGQLIPPFSTLVFEVELLEVL